MYRRFRWIVWGLLLLLAVAAGGLFLYVHTADFQRRMEAIVRGQLEKNTGARVAIGQFHFSFRPLRIHMQNVVLHGKESADQPPLAVIAEADLGLGLTSLLHPGVQLSQVFIGHPDIHIYRLPDGSTNLPSPATRGSGPPAQPVFDLGVRRLQVQQGELSLQDRKIPLNANVHDLRLHLRYLAATSPQAATNTVAAAHYEGELAYASSSIQYGAYLPAFQQAELQFLLWPNALRLRQLLLRGEGSRLQASLMIAPLTNPAIQGQYTLNAALAPLTRVAKIQGIETGDASIGGGFAWKGQSWNLTGHVHAIRIRMARPLPAAGEWSADGRFTADQDGLDVPALQLHGLGGTISLRAHDQHWNHLQADGKVDGVQLAKLEPLLASTGTTSAPVRTLERKLESRIDGTFHLDSTGPVNPGLRVGLALSLTPPAQPRAGAIPVSGALRGSAEPFRSMARIDQVDIQVPGNRLQANGTLRGQRGALQYTITSSNLSQLQPIVALFTQKPLPPFGGSGTLKGSVTGTLTSPQAAFDLRLQHPAYSRYTLDAVQADGTLRPNGLTLSHAQAALGRQQAMANGTVGLQHFQLTNASPLALNVTGENLDIATLQKLAGKNYPAGGQVTLQASITGSKGNPSGNGHVALRHAFWKQQKIDQAQADLQLSRNRIYARNLRVSAGQSAVTGNASWGLADDTYTVDLSTPGIHLTDVAMLESARLHLTGAVRFRVQGSGTLQNPQGRLQLSTIGLQGNGENLGQITATATAANDLLHLTANDVRHRGQLQLDAEASLNAPYTASAHLRMVDFDIDAALRRFTSAKLTGHSVVSGTATLQGPLQHPRDATVEANLGPIHLAVAGMDIHNDGPIQAKLVHEVVTLAPAHIVAQDTSFTLSGSARLQPNGPVNASAKGTIDLALLHSFNPAVQSSGRVLVDAAMTGTLQQPQMTGSIQIQNGLIAQENMPIAFDHIRGQLNFQGNRIQIQQLTANAGGGTLELTGYAARTPSGFAFDIGANGQNLRIRQDGISATGNINLHLNGQLTKALLAGEVQLTRISPTQNFDLAVFIANRRTATPMSTTNSLLSNTRLDLHVVTGPQVELATNVARLQMQADLRLRGTVANPIILGRASASQGEILFAGNKYTVSKAEIQFANPIRIEPILDVGLTTTVQQYDIALNVSGPVDKLNISYRSDPPLSSSDIISLLATGQTQEAKYNLSQESPTTFVGSSEQLLGQALGNVVASRVQRLFGITQIQVNPNLGGTPTTGSGTVTIQQQVSRNLKLTYTQNLSTSSQDIIQVDWTINRHLGLTLSRDQYGLYGFSFHFRHRAR